METFEGLIMTLMALGIVGLIALLDELFGKSPTGYCD